jgi:Flp pilus assembly pilin Flp
MSFSPPPIRALSLLRRFWTDERGMIVSAELMIIMTIGVLALVTGVSAVSSALNFEYTDVANALTSLNQSYNVSGHFAGAGGGGGGGTGGGRGGAYHAFNRGMGYNDRGNTFTASAVQASIAGSFNQSLQGFIETNAVAASSTQALALVEESALLVEEVAEVDATAVVETEAELEQRLLLLEEEAARLEAAQLKVQSAADCPDGCPLDELRDIEARIRRLRACLEQQNVFDCDQK